MNIKHVYMLHALKETLNRKCWKHRISLASVLTTRKETRRSNNGPCQSNSGQTLHHLLEVIPRWHSPVKSSDFALSCSIGAFSNTYGVSNMHFVWDNMNEWRLWAVFLNQGFFFFFFHSSSFLKAEVMLHWSSIHVTWVPFRTRRHLLFEFVASSLCTDWFFHPGTNGRFYRDFLSQ